nr:enhancer of mRNA-decapping protein 4 [Onthophagus taurus]XP_022909579.1 enhancer of mRNA-decapping protein 4 [Onthophagus taurus]
MDSPRTSTAASFSQKVNFTASEHDFNVKILAQDVTITCSSGSHNHGSSNVKLTNVVDYQWEMKYYVGHLIAIHIRGKIFAYAIKGKTGGMIRLAKTDSNQRALIKDIKGLVQDIAFAFTSTQILLGCADEEGNLYVYDIINNDSISCSLILHVTHPGPLYRCMTFRVIWCPYIPSYDENPDTIDDPAKLLVFLNGLKAEIWDVSVVAPKYNGINPIKPLPELEGKGYVDISGHSMDIIDASFSPDGTAIATASLDGLVKFYQVYTVDNEKPRCLHQWNPHEGKALSSLFFLDNINAFSQESKFWKFAVTGAESNSEIKIWTCESWTCLQTLHFKPSLSSSIKELSFKVCMDVSASFLLFSDIHNRVLYVLQINKNAEEKVACIDSISEFLLPASFITFCIADANIVSKTNFNNSSEEVYREDDLLEDFEEDANSKMVSISIYAVQPKRLQECTITFQHEYSSSLAFTNYDRPDIIEQSKSEEDNTENDEITRLDDLQSSVTKLLQQAANQQSAQPLNLMTPDDFNSPIINSSPSGLRNSSLNDASPSMIKKSLEKLAETTENLIDFQQTKDNFASGGSSPSREVQEILSFNNNAFNNPQEYFENLSKLDEASNFEEPINDTSAINKSSEVVWPDIPTMKAIEIQMKEENRRKEEEELNNFNWNKAQLQALNYRITSLESLLSEQNTLIQRLQHDLKTQKNSNNEYDLRALISGELDIALTKSHNQTAKLFENYLKEQKRMEWEQMDGIVTNIIKSVCQKINDNLQQIISHEIKEIVLPSIMATFDKLALKLDMHYSQKVNTIDQLLKSNIAKLVNSKQVTDALSLSIINVVKPSLEACYKDMITTTLIPSWEKVCNSMFLQIHNTFTQGTKEYTSSVETYMDRQRRVQDKGKDLIVQMQGVSDSMKNSADVLKSHLSAEIQKQFQAAFVNMQDNLKSTISEHVKEQIKTGFKTHAAALEDSVVNAVRSRAVTPSPHVLDTQVQLAQIQNMIAVGNIDMAFQQALSASASASDLSLVLYICEKVNPQNIFQPGNCLLQQHVLLSLIQQLGADLNHQTEVKLRFLEEGVLSLDSKNSVTREHLPGILRELSKQLTHYIMTNPTSKYMKNMRMLLMATQSVLKS